MMSSSRVRLVLLVVPALWGLVFVGVNRLLERLNAFQLVTLRFILISGAFGILLAVDPRLRPHYTASNGASSGLPA
ncbi:MAG: hypothetical protein KatS3mg011_2285 [Acidimicrobiia bacterium]|nr:MAG: hypothetical protein KatS3mg011_2285 [Acidimicrobiia bacterium]